jgi:hypothetical protein
MLRATDRGDCVVFSDAIDVEGARIQRSAWLLDHGSLVIATWKQDATGQWSQAQSYAVHVEAVRKLAELTARALDRDTLQPRCSQ